jgi:hypothetical protein
MSATGKTINSNFKLPKVYGWNTNSLTKSKMLSDMREAIESGLIELNDQDLINEFKSYTRNDLIDNSPDVRLTTRHWDLVVACFVKGTMVLTNRGQRPIETLVAGDLVMTRDGYKPITATMASYKKVTTNIGLTGTLDHPVFCNNNEIKDLSCVGKGDILYKWDSKAQKIERLSYTKVHSTIGIQTQNKEHTEYIISEEQSGKSPQNTYIERFGKITLERFQKVLSYTIRITTLTITILRTLRCFLPRNTCENMPKNQKGKNKLELSSKRIGIKSIYQLGNTIKTKFLEMLLVFNVVSRLVQSLIMPNTVLGYAHRGILEKRKRNLLKSTSVEFVKKHFKLEYPTRKDVQKNVVNSEEEKLTKVFNIQVADSPEYFANNILVHNCCIAWQMKDHARPAKQLVQYSVNRFKQETNPAE